MCLDEERLKKKKKKSFKTPKGVKRVYIYTRLRGNKQNHTYVFLFFLFFFLICIYIYIYWSNYPDRTTQTIRANRSDGNAHTNQATARDRSREASGVEIASKTRTRTHKNVKDIQHTVNNQ